MAGARAVAGSGAASGVLGGAGVTAGVRAIERAAAEMDEIKT